MLFLNKKWKKKKSLHCVSNTYKAKLLMWHTERDYHDVSVRIPFGDRPKLEDIDVSEAVGLKDMVDLMKNLWKEDAAERTTFEGSYILEDVVVLYPTLFSYDPFQSLKPCLLFQIAAESPKMCTHGTQVRLISLLLKFWSYWYNTWISLWQYFNNFCCSTVKCRLNVCMCLFALL